jgi:hypothetical protein
MNAIKTVVYLYQVVIHFLENGRAFRTYVAPATTNSVDLALVEPDNTAMKMLAAVTIVTSRAVRLSR